MVRGIRCIVVCACLVVSVMALRAAELPRAKPAADADFAEIPGEALAGVKAFRIRGYHQHLFPDRQPMAVFHERLERLAALDYNLVTFGMGTPSSSTISLHADGTISPNGCSTEDMRGLVSHAIALGLEPVFEMKYIGKQLPLIRELLAEFPGLVIDPTNKATVLNAAYEMPDGRSAYAATALRLIGYLLDLYPVEHPPVYFHLGIDEFDADDMASLAERLEMTPPQAFAHCVNLGTDYLLERGVTPLIWGDTLLSPQLGAPDHGITLPDYVPDPRHQSKPGGAYHADYRSGSVSLHTMVNTLRDRDRVIVADWHYGPSSTGEFPSVDTFQAMGFKDVWGCPWYNAINLRQFSRYAASRGCGGMVATAWHMAYLPGEYLRLEFILRSSAAHFHNPALEPCRVPSSFAIRGSKPGTRVDERRSGTVVPGETLLHFSAPFSSGFVPSDGLVLLFPEKRGADPIRASLSVDSESRQLRAGISFSSDVHIDQAFAVQFAYCEPESGYLHTVRAPQGFVVVDADNLPRPAGPGVLLEGDFRGVVVADFPSAVWLAGECATPLGVGKPKRGVGVPREGGLDTAWFDRLWVRPSSYLTRSMCRSTRIEIEVKQTGGFEGDDYCALLTKGSYNQGFRVLVGRDGRLLYQLAQADAGGPLWIHSRNPLPKDRWVALRLEHRAAGEGIAGEAYIYFDNVLEARVSVPLPMRPYPATVGIGCEFTTPVAGPRGKRRPNFPGLIRFLRLSQLEAGQ